MLLKSWSYCVALCLALFLRIEAKATFENNAYQDVLVTFSPRLAPEDGNHLVESMQKILNEASSVVQTATGVRIGRVTFHLPQSWNSSEWPSVGYVSSYNSKSEPDIQVKPLTDSAFGRKPVALQYGGCGVPALDISIPNVFLMSEEEEGSYSKGKILAREWLKYRYGVFDENGFLEDPMYPTHYSIHGSDEIHITDCTSPKLDYTFRDFENNTCVLTFETAANCSIRPNEEELENVKSSLMFYHEDLKQLDHICGKDEQTHNIGSLNKQNLICSYKSIWEVLQLHEDFKSIKTPSSSANKEIEYSFVQESELRLVIAWQDTASLFEKEKGDTILKVVRKVLYDIPSSSKIGLYNFKGGDWDAVQPFTQITQTIRDSWPRNSNFGRKSDGKPLVALEEGIKVLLADNEEDKKPGIIVIFTDSNPDENTDLVEQLKTSKLCLTVIGLKGATEDAWSPFLKASECSSFWEIPDSDNSLETYEKLYDAIEPIIPAQTEDAKIYTVLTKVLSFDEVMEIPANPRAKTFTVWINHDVAFECFVNETAINTTKEVSSSLLVAYSFEAQNDNVKCNMKDIPQGSYLVHIQMSTMEGQYFNNEVFFRDTTPPNSTEQMPYIIFAKIFYGEYPVRDADVQAEVTTPDGHKVALTLADNGRGDPDITQNDGIYSKYFFKFDSVGTYQVKITAKDNKKANASRNGQDPCCGSVIVSDSFELEEFEWIHETSFEIKLKKPENGYKPSRVTDLRVDTWNLPNSFTLKWTAPGEEMDEGKANSYAIRTFSSPEDIFLSFDNDNTSMPIKTTLVPKAFGQTETLEVKLDDFTDNETYFIALQSKRANELTSDTSNIVSIFVPKGKIDDKVTAQPPVKPSGASPETIGLIVGLILLAILVVVCVYLVVYFVVLKPKRKEERADPRSYSQRNPTRPSGLNSIPADVILKHHSEVVNAKSLHKDPPIFDEEKVEMSQAESSNTSGETENNNRNYAVPSRTIQTDPKKSPKRITPV